MSSGGVRRRLKPEDWIGICLKIQWPSVEDTWYEVEVGEGDSEDKFVVESIKGARPKFDDIFEFFPSGKTRGGNSVDHRWSFLSRTAARKFWKGKIIMIQWPCVEDVWYEVEVHEGADCDFVVQSADGADRRFANYFEFYPSGKDENGEDVEHRWAFVGGDLCQSDDDTKTTVAEEDTASGNISSSIDNCEAKATRTNQQQNQKTKKINPIFERWLCERKTHWSACRTDPVVGDIVWVKWLALEWGEKWYRCVVGEGEETTCPLVVESRAFVGGESFDGVYEFWPSGFAKNGESAGLIWNRQIPLDVACDDKEDRVSGEGGGWRCNNGHGDEDGGEINAAVPTIVAKLIDGDVLSRSNSEGEDAVAYEFRENIFAKMTQDQIRHLTFRQQMQYAEWLSRESTSKTPSSIPIPTMGVSSVTDATLGSSGRSGDGVGKRRSNQDIGVNPSSSDESKGCEESPVSSPPFTTKHCGTPMKISNGSRPLNKEARFRLTCPPFATGGQQLDIHIEGRGLHRFTVPTCVRSGDIFEILVRPAPASRKKATSSRRAKKKRKRYAVYTGAAPTVSDFFYFVVSREKLRIRKKRYADQKSMWTNDWIFANYKFTNVKREHDRTTRAFRALTDKRKEFMLSILRSTSMSDEERRVAIVRERGLMVFNCCLLRQFGTVAFAQATPYVTSWDDAAIERVTKICQSLLSRRKFSFAAAYQPQSIYRNGERRFFLDGDISVPLRWYRTICARLSGVWEIRDELARLADQTRSWRHVTNRLSKVRWFGGSGFHAKEAVQDMLHTLVFQRPKIDGNDEFVVWVNACDDLDTFCPVGPGARRGLNRIAGRDVHFGLDKTSPIVVNEFVKEMKDIFAEVKRRWPKMMLDSATPTLHLHDIQFQRCEFDKYRRVKTGDKRAKRYRPGEGGDTFSLSTCSRSNVSAKGVIRAVLKSIVSLVVEQHRHAASESPGVCVSVCLCVT